MIMRLMIAMLGRMLGSTFLLRRPHKESVAPNKRAPLSSGNVNQMEKNTNAIFLHQIRITNEVYK